MRAFPDEASREPLKAAFYQGADWVGELEAQIMPMLDDYFDVVVEDTAGWWSNWPGQAPAAGPVGDHRQTLHVVEATHEKEIRRRLAQDPWAQARLSEVGSIHPWALWLDRRTPGASPVLQGGVSPEVA